jgi:hypothetical protein
MEIRYFLPIRFPMPTSQQTVESVYRQVTAKGVLPKDLVPFAVDWRGSYFCFDADGHVFYFSLDGWHAWLSLAENQSRAKHLIAPTFSVFVSQLEKPPISGVSVTLPGRPVAEVEEKRELVERRINPHGLSGDDVDARWTNLSVERVIEQIQDSGSYLILRHHPEDEFKCEMTLASGGETSEFIRERAGARPMDGAEIIIATENLRSAFVLRQDGSVFLVPDDFA